MTVTGWIQLLALVAVPATLTPVVGGYTVRVVEGERVPLAPVPSCSSEDSIACAPQTGAREQDWEQDVRSLQRGELRAL
jgi:hypothetical protein